MGDPLLDQDDIGIRPYVDRYDGKLGRQNTGAKDYNWSRRWGENGGYKTGNTEVFLLPHISDAVLAINESWLPLYPGS
ncbi:hypothetical protein PISMIDRAFT_689057 [Pisolithus microcarpus 441]|uniref:Uncharacterized protein n=1 Tax=Pisolithus microcarpus 441 TaxID=765257 RepID=A0A0C9XL73_9AGAM|nr:hypothetical protein PISMIDRAFT_689057 [Pisolithus microcarpus 441]